MIEPARVQAAIEIVDQLNRSLEAHGPSADILLRKYFRTRRYAGSKDRRRVTELVYQVIRDWGFLMETSAGDSRKMMLLALNNADLFTGQNYAPATTTDEERNFLAEDHEKKPHHRLNYPEWLAGRLQHRFGDNFDAELIKLNRRAPFALRVNSTKSTVAAVKDFFKAENIDYRRGKWAETALILAGYPRIDSWDIYKNGAVEIQDEAAQLAVALCDIKPGQQVMDLCAGAGGKTLAAAAYMNNQGQIYAFDNDLRRMKDLKPRAKRANIHIIQGRHLDTAGGKRQKILSEHLEFKGGASHASGGNSSSEQASGSSPQPDKKGGASHASGGNSSSEGTSGSSPQPDKKGGASHASGGNSDTRSHKTEARATVSNIGRPSLCEESQARAPAIEADIKTSGSSPHQTKTGRMDRVIIDVPCSGSGVWRRNPEAKWRLTEAKLGQYCRIQQNLLVEGWQFVKPGGRMIYMTCSLFHDENEQQVTTFLGATANARLISYQDIYRHGELKTLSSIPECLALSPGVHDTDGFFIAIIEKII